MWRAYSGATKIYMKIPFRVRRLTLSVRYTHPAQLGIRQCNNIVYPLHFSHSSDGMANPLTIFGISSRCFEVPTTVNQHFDIRRQKVRVMGFAF